MWRFLDSGGLSERDDSVSDITMTVEANVRITPTRREKAGQQRARLLEAFSKISVGLCVEYLEVLQMSSISPQTRDVA